MSHEKCIGNHFAWSGALTHGPFQTGIFAVCFPSGQLLARIHSDIPIWNCIRTTLIPHEIWNVILFACFPINSISHQVNIACMASTPQHSRCLGILRQHPPNANAYGSPKRHSIDYLISCQFSRLPFLRCRWKSWIVNAEKTSVDRSLSTATFLFNWALVWAQTDCLCWCIGEFIAAGVASINAS